MNVCSTAQSNAQAEMFSVNIYRLSDYIWPVKYSLSQMAFEFCIYEERYYPGTSVHHDKYISQI